MRITTLLLPLVLAGLATLTGCATTSMPVDALQDVPADRLQWKRPANAGATLVVARDRGFSGSATTVRVTVDGVAAGDLLGAERLTLGVAPGRRLVSASVHVGGEVRKPRTLEVTVGPGQRAVVRVGFDDGASGFSVWVDPAAS